MSDDQPSDGQPSQHQIAGEPASGDRPVPNIGDDAVARVTRDSGASKEQVEQLARATDGKPDALDDAAAAAARWS